MSGIQVDNEKERFTVSLKQSLVGASDAAYLQSLLKDLEVAEALRYINVMSSAQLCRFKWLYIQWAVKSASHVEPCICFGTSCVYGFMQPVCNCF